MTYSEAASLTRMIAELKPDILKSNLQISESGKRLNDSEYIKLMSIIKENAEIRHEVYSELQKTGTALDNWGNRYEIVICLHGNEVLVALWSIGRDKKSYTDDDIVISSLDNKIREHHKKLEK